MTTDGEHNRSTGARVKAVINADIAGPVISRHLYGHFAEHLGRCIYDGFFVGPTSEIPNVDGIRLDVVQALRELAIPNLRWPGGCFADQYHWRDGTGPVAARPNIINSNWGDLVEDNSFGTHEFLQLCELLGAEPYISANLASGTIREASEWVEYLNRADDSPMARLRRAHGREAPWGVRFWGLGNEPWGCGGRFSDESYADLAHRFAVFCRDHGDAKLYRIAAGADSTNYSWTETLMKSQGLKLGEGDVGGRREGLFDAISLHYYTMPGGWAHKGSATRFDTDEYYKTIAAARRVRDVLHRHISVMDAYDPDHTMGLVLDEWGTWFDVEDGTEPGFLYQQNTLRDALVASIHFDAFHEVSDRLVMANIAQTVNVLQSVLLTDGPVLVRTPTYHVFEMNRPHQEALSLPVSLTSSAPTVSVGDTVLETLSMSASRSDASVLISITNAHATDTVNVELELRGVCAGDPIARVLTASALNEYNTGASPDLVTPRPWTRLQWSEPVLDLELPPHSFVTVSIPILST